mmetsp:Transcript_3766/g.9109  ORF Transcript_3766/g.9109 Transcript_3766/m.9109 type:complete len:222 (+) Transcript_3766:143-808(+)
MTRSMSSGLIPVSSMVSLLSASTSSGSAGAAAAVAAMASLAAASCPAACWRAAAPESSDLASPKMTYVSVELDLKTSGLLMAKRTFRDFLTVTRRIPGTGFMPSFCMALRAFFSFRFWMEGGMAAAMAAAAAAAALGSSAPASSSWGTSSISSSWGTSSAVSSISSISGMVEIRLLGSGKKVEGRWQVLYRRECESAGSVCGNEKAGGGVCWFWLLVLLPV